MNLKNLDEVGELGRELTSARRTLKVVESLDVDTVSSFATSNCCSPGLHFSVELMPVPKDIAVSAARREVAKLVGKLRQLGVSVDD